MAKTDDRSLSLAALARAVADPAPRPLMGTKARPGIFIGGSQAVRACASRCVEQGWFEPTGQFEGQGRSKKPLYRITPKGIAHALEHGEPAELLRDMLAALDVQNKRLERMQAEVAGAAALTQNQTQAVQELLQRAAPPNLRELLQSAAGSSNGPVADSPSLADWRQKAVAYLNEHRRRNPYGRCPLPELFQQTAAPAGLTIGQFHDGLRQLAAEGRIALFPFTGAAYQLRDEQYALVAGQEIKYYVELVAG
jgi:hypothetical protein